MNGYRFYAEMPEHRGSKSASKDYHAFTRKTLNDGAARGMRCNCLAVTEGRGDMLDVIAPTMGTSDSPVASATASRDYLRKRCVRISEALARALHPNLFRALDL